MPKLRKLSRQQRKDLILGIVYRSAEPMRILEIARAMNIARSPYLLELLNQLVDDGELDTVEVEVAPDLPARAYVPSARNA